MIRLEITERRGARLYATLVKAMRSGDLRTFSVKNRGRTVQHIRYPGRLKWSPGEGRIVGVLQSPGKTGNEWQLLSAFVGRLAHRYNDRIESIRVEFPEAVRRGGKRPAASRRKR